MKPGPGTCGIVQSAHEVSSPVRAVRTQRGGVLGADHHRVGKAASRVAKGERGSASVDGVRVDPDFAAIGDFDRQPHGLLVAWGGLSKPAQDTLKTCESGFGRPPMLSRQCWGTYDRLDDEIRSSLPLKRVWMLADTGA